MHASAKDFQNPNLDILRSIAVLAVFVSHLLQVLAGCRFGERYAFGIETYCLGNIGVLIFFVHTSLVLMQSMERTDRSGWLLVRSFYIRRAFRIYPLSICLIVISTAYSIPPNALGVPYIWHGVKWVAANTLLIQNIGNIGSVSGPMWSLPYEVQMYLVLPILFMLLKSRDGGLRLGAIYIVSLFLSLTYPLLAFVPCFLSGVVGYRLLGIVRPRFRSWLWCPTLLGLVTVYALIPYSIWIKDILACLLVGTLIPLFRKSRHTAVASNIAKYSYGIYLCHMPILWLLYQKLTIPTWERLFLLALAMVTVPVLCYRFIEHPLILMGIRLADRITVKQKVAVAVPV